MRHRSLVGLTLILTLSAASAFSAQRQKMIGRWYNYKSSQELTIEADGDDVRVVLGDNGTGLVYDGPGGGANIAIEGSHFSCSYFMSFIDAGARMTLKRKTGNPSVCIDGTFAKVDKESSTSSQSEDSVGVRTHRPMLRYADDLGLDLGECADKDQSGRKIYVKGEPYRGEWCE